MASFWAANLEANLAVIKKNYGGLAEQIITATDENITIEDSAAGPPTLVINGVHIHSKRDPVREGRRLVESILHNNNDDESPALILGFGLGYAAEALALQNKKRPLIIVEHRLAVLKKAFESRDLRRFLTEHKLVFVSGSSSSAVIGALDLFGRIEPLILRQKPLMDIDEDWYAETERHIKTWLSKDEVNMATLRRFGKRWVRNLAANMEAIRDFSGVSPLEGILSGALRGVPVFLAAAGPSLDKVFPHLREIARRCLVVAVDTSLRFLLNAGVNPDFVLVVDPQYWNSRHLDHAPAPETCLVAESAVYPAVLRHRFGHTLLCGSLFPLGRFIEEKVDEKGRLGAGGSVASTAWDFARLMEPEKIFIAGLDLGFPELKTHFKGARFEEKALAESNRFVPVETWSVRALRDGQPFKANDATGKILLTDRRLSLYASWFENRFRQFPHIQNRRLSPEGIAIKGLENGSVEDIFALPPRRDEINRCLCEIFSSMEKEFSSPEKKTWREKYYREARASLIQNLEEIKNNAEAAAAIASRGMRGKVNQHEQEKILRKLDDITARIIKNEAKETAGFLFPQAEELEKELKTPPSEPLKRHLEFSAKFYRAIADAAAYPLDLLKSRA
ncbi:hypothetical protein AGMMS49928_07720 [Spirochaetia bacterium]|nr:hypothetical protein AGMMS49928_07720 [Spirochaetia bacterium]